MSKKIVLINTSSVGGLKPRVAPSNVILCCCEELVLECELLPCEVNVFFSQSNTMEVLLGISLNTSSSSTTDSSSRHTITFSAVHFKDSLACPTKQKPNKCFNIVLKRKKQFFTYQQKTVIY